ncbi:uncharacterized protein [Diadema setosum]|uniref:uncharacterized protein n=1 Tax=Diadema setosum TaxID=31175 RepID=UPI003B3A2275
MLEDIANKSSLTVIINYNQSSPVISLTHEIQLSIFYGIYIYPVNFKLSVKCYEGIPSVKMVDGPSPIEGLVVLEPVSYVCYDGFTSKAAEVICGELGFPAAEEYSAQTLPITAKRHSYQRVLCSEGDSFRRLMDCSNVSTKCLMNQTVRLKCRGPLGSCDHPGHVPYGNWDSSDTNFGSRLTLTCDESYVINGSATLQCVGLPGWSTYFPVWNAPVPSCSRVENKRDDDNHNNSHRKKAIASTLGILLSVILALSALSIALCNHLQKRRHMPPEASNQSNDRQQCAKETGRGVLNPTSADGGIVSQPLTDHPDNRLGTLSAHQEDPYHVSQDIAEIETMPWHLAGAETTSLPSRNEYRSLQETSTEQNNYHQVDYRDRQHRGKDRRMTNGVSKGEPCLFDEIYYNSLNFGIKSDGVCTHTRDANIRNAHPKRGRYTDTTGVNRAPSSVGSSTAMFSDQVVHYQVDPDNGTDTCKTPLYAKVDKKRKNIMYK